MRHHQVGARVWLWELLVDPREPSIDDAATRRARALQRRYQYLTR